MLKEKRILWRNMVEANQYQRTEMLIGKNGIDKIKKAKVVIFGLGGVGSYVLEALARAGVENLVLVDKDVVDVTNINRQIIATHKTVGKDKVKIAKQRVLDINPNSNVEIYKEFFRPESDDKIINNTITYIVDCVDTVTAKIELAVRANKLKIPIISSMGTGNKLDPTRFEIADIYKTSVCPLAKVMRKELKDRGITNLKVVYSKEEPIKVESPKGIEKKSTPGSISFVPSVCGLIIASEVVRDILKED